MISIIIPQCKEHTYLPRCLSSIQRQSYQELDIIIIGKDYPQYLIEQYALKVIEPENDGKYAGIKKAIQRAKGDYLFFASMTSVLSNNTLEELIEKNKKEHTFLCACCYIPVGEDFMISKKSFATIYGKLFKKERMRCKNITFPKQDIFAEQFFTLEYLKDDSTIELNDSVFIYETNAEAFDQEGIENLSEHDYHSLLTSISKLPKLPGTSYMEVIIDACNKSDTLPAYFLFLAAQILHVEYEFNYCLGKKTLNGWFESIEHKQDEAAYELFRTYMELYKEEKGFLNLLLSQWGLTANQYEDMKGYDCASFLFYKEAVSEQNGTEQQLKQEVETIKEQMNQSIKQLEQLSLEVRVQSGEESFSSLLNTNLIDRELNLSGPDLADFMIEKYRQGGLGIKTIFKSFGAWMKYKL